MIEDRRVENVFGLAAFDGVRDLLNATTVEAFYGGRCDSCVVVCADDSGMTFVDCPRSIDRVIHDIVEELVFTDRPVDIIVVDQVATARVD